jgi:hypothetical protein
MLLIGSALVLLALNELVGRYRYPPVQQRR